MAGDWIKWCKGFARKPEIIAMADALQKSRHEIATAYMEVCEWLDTEGKPDDPDDVDSDITLTLLSRSARDKRHALLRTLDDVARVTGMGEALISVAWIELTDVSIVFKRAARHNTETGKQRALAANRQRRKRAKDVSRFHRDKNVTREEKRRVIDTPIVPFVLDFAKIGLKAGFDTEEVRDLLSQWVTIRAKKHGNLIDPEQTIAAALPLFPTPKHLVHNLRIAVSGEWKNLNNREEPPTNDKPAATRKTFV